ncbi:hypothetical protein HYU23_01730 [Candidatus Woesearchaeota archaeon]|nr:hypothetical protein [Candidatus Woesearchaeota archaeon]
MSEARSTKNILVHELGHYLCAEKLGYKSEIIFDVAKKTFLNIFDIREDLPKAIDLKNQAIIACGGIVAEGLFGIESETFWGDMIHLFDVTKELANINGERFPYKKPYEMGIDFYSIYYNGAKIIESYGGKIILRF